MPYKSDAQRRWAHTASGEKALGKEGVKEWDSASKGLKLPKRVSEHPKHFEVEPHEGPSFKVAKKGLSPKVMHRLQGMCMGGQVQKMADGGKVKDTYDPANEPQAAKDFWAQYEPQLKADDAAIPKLGTEFVPSGMSSQAIVSGPDVGAGAPMQTVPIGQLGAHPTPGVAGADASAQAFGAPEAAPSMPAAAPVAPALPSVGGVGPTSQDKKTLDAIAEGRKTSAEQTAKVEQDYAAQVAKAKQDTEDALIAKQAIHAQEAQKVKDENDTLYNDIKSSKIDPNHWYANQDTGGKISAALAMIVGGLGAGLSKGPNLGLEMINKQIDRDIQAQKDDLGRKQNLMSINFKKLGDMDAAYAQTRLDTLTDASLRIDKLSALAKGDAAKANLAAVKAGIDEQRYKAGLDVAGFRTAQALHGIQIAVGKQQLLAMQQAQQNAPQMQMLANKFSSGNLSREEYRALPPQAQKLALELPNGKLVQAKSEDAEKEASKSLNEIGALEEPLKQLEALKREHGDLAGKPGFGKRQVEQVRAVLSMMSPKAIAGLSRVTQVEIDTANDKIVPKPGFFTDFDGTLSALKDIVRANQRRIIKNAAPGADESAFADASDIPQVKAQR